MKLKTLKDLDWNEIDVPIDDETSSDVVLVSELKQEAIRWINYLKEIPCDCPCIDGEDVCEGCRAEFKIYWIKHFFNITKEDLEVVDESPQDYKEQLKEIEEQAVKEDIECKADLKRKES